MPLRPCLEPGCGVKVTRSRCAKHSRARERARGTRQERGYGAEHDRLKADLQRRMDAGEVFTCWRCAELGRPHPVDPTSWDLGHDDVDRSVYRGPECPGGNRATNGRENLSSTDPKNLPFT
jgi:hypothetical protein